jgi:anti-sigma B factor antagonist
LTIHHLDVVDGTATVTCHGRITIETSELFKSEVKSLAAGHQRVLADLSDVDFVDSFGLGSVLAAYVSARATGCELQLINVNPRVKDLLNMTRLATILEQPASE